MPLPGATLTAQKSSLSSWRTSSAETAPPPARPAPVQQRTGGDSRSAAVQRNWRTPEETSSRSSAATVAPSSMDFDSSWQSELKAIKAEQQRALERLKEVRAKVQACNASLERVKSTLSSHGSSVKSLAREVRTDLDEAYRLLRSVKADSQAAASRPAAAASASSSSPAPRSSWRESMDLNSGSSRPVAASPSASRSSWR